jgi:hypothetical protein
LFAFLFVVVGIMNIRVIHIVPGLFYLAISLFYLPKIGTYLDGKFGRTAPFLIQVIFGLFIIWASLAVGDLAEFYGL